MMMNHSSFIDEKWYKKGFIALILVLFILLVHVESSYAVVTIRDTNPMNTSRGWYPAAALLSDGRVIVIGGSGITTGSSEISLVLTNKRWLLTKKNSKDCNNKLVKNITIKKER